MKRPPELEYDAMLYGLTHLGNKGDIEYYTKHCRDAEAVLELGSGLGRILIPLAESGIRITGLDYHPGMLELLRIMIDQNENTDSGLVSLYRGDFRKFDLRKKFDRIIIPFNTVFCLSNDEDILACFARVKHHLAIGGKFLFDVYIPKREEFVEYSGKDWVFFRNVSLSEKEIEIQYRSTWNEPEQRAELFYRYLITEGCATCEKIHSVNQRYLFPGQLETLIERAGFEIEDLYGNFSGDGFSEDSGNFVAQLRVAG